MTGHVVFVGTENAAESLDDVQMKDSGGSHADITNELTEARSCDALSFSHLVGIRLLQHVLQSGWR